MEALLEPKCQSSSLTVLQRKLHCTGSVTNTEGTIWVLWKSDLQCGVLQNEAQQITLSCTQNSFNFVVTCIYASYKADVRKQLWDSLLQPGHNGPWMAIGDFNVV